MYIEFIFILIIKFYFYIGSLDETPKVNQLEDDRFSRMQHFYGSEDIDPETLEDLDLGDDGKVK
jgi:hypothetical protein